MVLLLVIVFLFILVAIGSIYQYISTKIDEKKYPPPGTLVDVGGYKLHIHCTGDKGPMVVLDSGLGVDSLGWSLVQPEIAKFARVLSYDRAGYGWSEKSPYPRTSEQIVKELHTLLVNAKISPPYILVGHSFGGVNAQIYAKLYPDEVSGLVLVDSGHEKDEELPSGPKRSWKEKLFSSFPFLLILDYLGIRRYRMHSNKYKKAFDEFFRSFLIADRNRILANKCKIKQGKAIIGEATHLKESFMQLKRVNSSFGDLPLIVIASSKLVDTKGMAEGKKEYVEKLNSAFRAFQEDFATRSTKGKLMVAENSDHMIPLKQPEMIVEAVRSLIGHV